MARPTRQQRCKVEIKSNNGNYVCRLGPTSCRWRASRLCQPPHAKLLQVQPLPSSGTSPATKSAQGARTKRQAETASETPVRYNINTYILSHILSHQHVQLLLYRATLEGLLSRPTLGEGVFLIFHEDIFPFRFLIGIVSFGETYCGGLNNPRPGVYTNITSHVQWVRSRNHPQHPQPPDP